MAETKKTKPEKTEKPKSEKTETVFLDELPEDAYAADSVPLEEVEPTAPDTAEPATEPTAQPAEDEPAGAEDEACAEGIKLKTVTDGDTNADADEPGMETSKEVGPELLDSAEQGIDTATTKQDGTSRPAQRLNKKTERLARNHSVAAEDVSGVDTDA